MRQPRQTNLRVGRAFLARHLHKDDQRPSTQELSHHGRRRQPHCCHLWTRCTLPPRQDNKVYTRARTIKPSSPPISQDVKVFQQFHDFNFSTWWNFLDWMLHPVMEHTCAWLSIMYPTELPLKYPNKWMINSVKVECQNPQKFTFHFFLLLDYLLCYYLWPTM